MKPITLYSYPTSPYAQKVGCYLKYKHLDYSFVAVNPLHNKEIAFSQQTQVPVLMIGDEWRKNSSDLGVWLDELHPDRPILPVDQNAREKVLAIDGWISSSLIPSYFRGGVEWENTWNAIRNGWKLASAVNDATPLPFFIRMIWPFAVKRAPFINRMVSQLDLTESLADMNVRLQKEFKEHLAEGPFLGSQSLPTLADLSAFPIIASSTFMGMKREQAVINDPAIRAWAKRVHSHLPKNPLLVPDSMLETLEL